MTAPEPRTVRAAHDHPAVVTVEFLAGMARDLGWSCLCRGRGQVDSSLGYDIECPVCHGVGAVAA